MAAEQVNTRLAANLGNVELTSASGASVVYLDSAVALLELSGNVQVFGPGRSFFSRTPDAQKRWHLQDQETKYPILDVHGWDTAEAFAALRSAHSDDILSLGRNGDETWEILARPRPELEHRCTLIAIRKLVAHRADPRPATAATRSSAPRCGRPRRSTATPRASGPPSRSLELLTLARRIAPTPAAAAPHRRDRHRQGDARARHPPRLRPRRPPARPVQLHRRPARHAREPAVRLPPRRLHRRRHRVPRRHPQPPPAARCSSTRSATSASTCSRSSCASSRPARSTRSASRSRSRSTSASSPRPTPTSSSLVAEGRFREDLFYRLNVVHAAAAAAARAPRGNSAAAPALPAANAATSRRRAG